jgi:Galactose-3-O-sulfotransferase
VTDRTVIFLHLPKAAGSTLNRVIARQYAPTEIYKTAGKPLQVVGSELAAEPRVRLIAGHIGFGVHSFLTRPFTYITVLRDPVERMLSHYHFARKLTTHPMHTEIAKGLSLSDAARRLANLQTRYLADESVRGTSETAGRDALESAKENVSRYFAVAGLAERFDETLVLLGRHLGWKIRPVTNSNVTRGLPKRQAHSDGELRAIREMNALDVELHDWARSRFEQEVVQGGTAFRAQVTWLRWRNRVLQLGGRLAQRKAGAS